MSKYENDIVLNVPTPFDCGVNMQYCVVLTHLSKIGLEFKHRGLFLNIHKQTLIKIKTYIQTERFSPKFKNFFNMHEYV